MRDYRDAKAMAQTLRQALKERSVSLTHSESLELIAKVLGLADWNVLSARIQAEPAPAATAPRTASAINRPVLPLRDIVLFPQLTTPIYAMRLKSIAAIERAMAGEKEIFFATQRRMADDDPKPEDLHQVGVIASVMQLHKLLDGSIRMMVNGLRRAEVLRIDTDDGCLIARLAPIEEGARSQMRLPP